MKHNYSSFLFLTVSGKFWLLVEIGKFGEYFELYLARELYKSLSGVVKSRLQCVNEQNSCNSVLTNIIVVTALFGTGLV